LDCDLFDENNDSVARCWHYQHRLFSRSWDHFRIDTNDFLYLALLPLNCLRLYQMIDLVKQIRQATQGDFSLDWLKPYMTRRRCMKGEILFRKGDHADHMFYIISGHFYIPELKLEIPAGQMFGETAFVSPDSRRTQTVECLGSGEILEVSYDKVRELYLQNPPFAFYLLRLSSQRLLQNLTKMEMALAECLAIKSHGASLSHGSDDN
jgi:CRP/FNR family transcriptional regulator, cyclic AMP receptor protein